ncbi:MAG: hypothetical protein ABIT64_05020 [Lysobacteraceae bacterium]
MNTNDHEARIQAEAERAEREGLASGRDPRVDRYRLVVRALRQPLEPQLPADFASRVAAIALQRDRGEGLEEWIVVFLMLAMGVGALVFVGPALAGMMHTVVSVQLPPLPWHQVTMAAICIGVVWAIERGLVRVHQHGSRHV